jgi:hypothetical protein
MELTNSELDAASFQAAMNIMRERAIKEILSLTNAYSREELESIKETLELVALKWDVKKILNN